MEKTNLERAKELFKAEPNINKVYFTKDGNMFRAEHYARDWAKGSNAGEIETIHRDGTSENSETVTSEDLKVKKATKAKDDNANNDAEEKAELTKRYIELFDTKPNHLTGIPKLKELIAAKELEIKNAAGSQE